MEEESYNVNVEIRLGINRKKVISSASLAEFISFRKEVTCAPSI